MRNVQVPGFCNFTVNSAECSEALKVQPEKATFCLDYGPNYHPTFEIRLTSGSELINLTIQDTDKTVWKHEVDLTDGTAEEPQPPSPLPLHTESVVTFRELLSSVRLDIIERVTDPVLKQVLDRLLASKVLNEAEKEKVVNMNRDKQDRADHLLDSVLKKGEKASRLFLMELCELDPFLYEDLKLPTIAEDRL